MKFILQTAVKNPKYLLQRANELWMMMNIEGSNPKGVSNVLGMLSLYQALIEDNQEYYFQEGIL